MNNLLFNGKGKAAHFMTDREKYASSYNAARSNLLVIIIFTVINGLLLIANANTYFLFTASVPYIILDFAMYVCGKYPAEFYGDMSQYTFMSEGAFVFLCSVALLIVLAYLACWLFSKNGKVAWLITSLVLFGVDTVLMFFNYGINVGMLLDYLFHGWIIFILINGIISYYKLKALPPEETTVPEVSAETSEAQYETTPAAEEETNVEKENKDETV